MRLTYFQFSSANREAQNFNLILCGDANRARYGIDEAGGRAAEACLLSQWPVWAVVAFPLQPADEAVRIGPTPRCPNASVA